MANMDYMDADVRCPKKAEKLNSMSFRKHDKYRMKNISSN